MNIIYWSEKGNTKGEKEALLKKAFFYYIKETRPKVCKIREYVNALNFEVDEGGKPYIEGRGIEFSISHSKEIWMILLSDERCGVDVQEVKDINALPIAKRYFSPNEVKYIEDGGLDSFYRIWTVREAYGKMTGIGFHCSPPDFMDGENKLKNVVNYDGGLYNLERIYLKAGFEAASCYIGDSPLIRFMDDLEDPEYSEAVKAALRKLSSGNISSGEMRTFLKRKGFDDETIGKATDYLEEMNYLDDVRYSELYFRYGESKGWAKGRIVRELKRKGLRDSDIEEGYYSHIEEKGESEEEWTKALEIIEKMADKSDLDERGRLQEKVKARIVRRLYSYGYTTDSILRAISKFQEM